MKIFLDGNQNLANVMMSNVERFKTGRKSYGQWYIEQAICKMQQMAIAFIHLFIHTNEIKKKRRRCLLDSASQAQFLFSAFLFRAPAAASAIQRIFAYIQRLVVGCPLSEAFVGVEIHRVDFLLWRRCQRNAICRVRLLLAVGDCIVTGQFPLRVAQRHRQLVRGK